MLPAVTREINYLGDGCLFGRLDGQEASLLQAGDAEHLAYFAVLVGREALASVPSRVLVVREGICGNHFYHNTDVLASVRLHDNEFSGFDVSGCRGSQHEVTVRMLEMNLAQHMYAALTRE